jgi:hypothetical protein
MKNTLLVIILLSNASLAQAQLTAYDILQKSIKVHNPNQGWHRLKAAFDMSIVREKQADRFFTIDLNVPKNSSFIK